MAETKKSTKRLKDSPFPVPNNARKLFKLYLKGMSIRAICEELEINNQTGRNYLIRAGAPLPQTWKEANKDLKTNEELLALFVDPHAPTLPELAEAIRLDLFPFPEPDAVRGNYREVFMEVFEEVVSKADQTGSQTAEFLEKALSGSIQQAHDEARDREEVAMAASAGAQVSPADQYQQYVAGQMLRLLRDGVKTIQPPKTIKEAEMLDRIIRRNLGLNPTGGSSGSGSGHGRLSLDINILNDRGAARKSGLTLEAQVKDARKEELLSQKQPTETQNAIPKEELAAAESSKRK